MRIASSILAVVAALGLAGCLETPAGDDTFTGVALSYAPRRDGEAVIVERTRYVDGKRHGIRMRWYPSGRLQSRTMFADGRRDGVSESFWEDGNRRALSTYRAGKLHGVATQWYREGMLFKRRQLVDGREEGMQQGWRRDGSLYANYEARNGRNYGLNNAELCSTVGD